MAIFGDEDNMVERLVGIDARGFLDGTLTSRRGFQLTGPGTRVSPRYSWRFRVLTKGLSYRAAYARSPKLPRGLCLKPYASERHMREDRAAGKAAGKAASETHLVMPQQS